MCERATVRAAPSSSVGTPPEELDCPGRSRDERVEEDPNWATQAAAGLSHVSARRPSGRVAPRARALPEQRRHRTDEDAEQYGPRHEPPAALQPILRQRRAVEGEHGRREPEALTTGHGPGRRASTITAPASRSTTDAPRTASRSGGATHGDEDRLRPAQRSMSARLARATPRRPRAPIVARRCARTVVPRNKRHPSVPGGTSPTSARAHERQAANVERHAVADPIAPTAPRPPQTTSARRRVARSRRPGCIHVRQRRRGAETATGAPSQSAHRCATTPVSTCERQRAEDERRPSTPRRHARPSRAATAPVPGQEATGSTTETAGAPRAAVAMTAEEQHTSITAPDARPPAADVRPAAR